MNIKQEGNTLKIKLNTKNYEENAKMFGFEIKEHKGKFILFHEKEIPMVFNTSKEAHEEMLKKLKENNNE